MSKPESQIRVFLLIATLTVILFIGFANSSKPTTGADPKTSLESPDSNIVLQEILTELQSISSTLKRIEEEKLTLSDIPAADSNNSSNITDSQQFSTIETLLNRILNAIGEPNDKWGNISEKLSWIIRFID